MFCTPGLPVIPTPYITRHYKLQRKTPSCFQTCKTFGKQVLSIEACHFEKGVNICICTYICKCFTGEVLKVLVCFKKILFIKLLFQLLLQPCGYPGTRTIWAQPVKTDFKKHKIAFWVLKNDNKSKKTEFKQWKYTTTSEKYRIWKTKVWHTGHNAIITTKTKTICFV